MPDPIINHDGHFTIFIKTYWPIGAAIIAFIVSVLVVLKGKIPFMDKKLDDALKKIEKLENSNFISKGILFDKNDNFRFQSIPMCQDMRKECHMQQKMNQDNFCRKLDDITVELKGIVKDADLKRDETRNEITSMNKRLIELMTQMKTILARDRKEEVADMVKTVVREVALQIAKKNNIN
jgi:hypothetical protein